MNKTTTVLTIDLPGDLGDRLRQALSERPGQSLRDVAIEALREWLDRRESEGGSSRGPARPGEAAGG